MPSEEVVILGEGLHQVLKFFGLQIEGLFLEGADRHRTRIDARVLANKVADHFGGIVFGRKNAGIRGR